MNPTSKYRLDSGMAGYRTVIFPVLFCRFRFFRSIPRYFVLLSVVSYFLFFNFFFAGIARKKELGGFADVREIFTAIFISILITELIYIFFSCICKFIDPGF